MHCKLSVVIELFKQVSDLGFIKMGKLFEYGEDVVFKLFLVACVGALCVLDDRVLARKKTASEERF